MTNQNVEEIAKKHCMEEWAKSKIDTSIPPQFIIDAMKEYAASCMRHLLEEVSQVEGLQFENIQKDLIPKHEVIELMKSHLDE